MNRFLKGAMILTIAGIVVKIMGALSKVILARILGAEGIGLYQMAYLFYQLVISIGAAGLPVAVSIMISERLAISDIRGANRIFRVVGLFMAAVGGFFSFLFFFMAPVLIDWGIIVDKRAELALEAVAPAIVLVTILATFRGYFQGFQNMLPTGVSQVFEQGVRVSTMVIFSILLLSQGLAWAAAGAAVSSVLGVGTGLMVLVFFFVRERAQRAELWTKQDERASIPKSSAIIKRLLYLTIPVALANVMIPVVAGIDLIIVPQRLIIGGYTPEEATTLFGYLSGMATSLISLPIILTTSFASSLVPAISEAYVQKDLGHIYKRVDTAMGIANLITIPAFVGLCVLATPVSQMMFNTMHAGGPIAIMSVSIFFLGVQQITTGLLQGIGRTFLPMLSLVIASLVKLLLNYVLTSSFGINGAAWATNVDFAMAAAMNLYFAKRYTGYAMEWNGLMKVGFCALAMGGATVMMYYFLHTSISNAWAVCLSILWAIIIYSGALIVTKSIDESTLEAVPKLHKVVGKIKGMKS